MENARQTLFIAEQGVIELANKMRARIGQHYSNRRIIVKGFHPRTRAEELEHHFSQFGVVEDVYIPGTSYAFITFSRLSVVPPYSHQFNGRLIVAQKLEPFNNPQMKTRVILANGIFNSISNAALMKYFSKFGDVESVKKQRADPISRFAYITFKDIRTAENIVKNPVHLIENQIIDVRKARTPNE